MVAILAVASLGAVGYGTGLVIAGTAAPQPGAAQPGAPGDLAVLRPSDPAAAAILRGAAARDVPAKVPATGPSADPAPGTRPAGDPSGDAPPAEAPHLVRMAHLTLPVRKPQSVTYVVAEVAVSLADAHSAAQYEIPQNASRLQAAIERAMDRAAGAGALGGVALDAEALSGRIVADLRDEFEGVEDLLFVTLYKHDVAHR